MIRDNRTVEHDIQKQELAQRLKHEGSGTIANLTTDLSFESVWEGELKQMRQVKESGSGSRFRRVFAVVAVLLLAAAAIFGIRLLDSSKPMPAVSDVSDIKFRELRDIYAPTTGRRVVDEQIEKLSTPLNIVLKDQDVTLTLVKAYYDGGRVMIDYVVDDQSGGADLNEKNASFDYKLKTSADGKEWDQSSTRSKTFLGSHRFAGTLTYMFKSYNGPTALSVDLKVSRLATKNGKWEAKIPLSSAKTDKLTSTFYPGTSFTYEGNAFTLTEVSSGPTFNLIRMAQKATGQISTKGIMYYDDVDTRFYQQWMTGDDFEEGSVQWVEVLDPFVPTNPKPSSLKLHIFESQTMDDTNTGTATQPFEGKTPITLTGFDGETMTLTNIDFQKERTVVQLKYSDLNVQTWFPYFNSSKTDGDYVAYYNPQRISKNELLFEAIFPPMDPDELTGFAATTSKQPKFESVEIPLEWDKAIPGRPKAIPAASE
ncbi:DUF4179 domain-containing protein [Saccharibacillus brassicae]|uniref:DUF4179 domain-containing protein n=1 Tax=Saccharibacillus brassicae TaxID=2583377 RepID=A0A4Y6V3Y0_SACBS|nr:DUF4179 domain-containing protein [Saccharibacillus brassicae]QDH23331.1 DUF4179 domain-containing protein [Saccharibacillus brassicae]